MSAFVKIYCQSFDKRGEPTKELNFCVDKYLYLNFLSRSPVSKKKTTKRERVFWRVNLRAMSRATLIHLLFSPWAHLHLGFSVK